MLGLAHKDSLKYLGICYMDKHDPISTQLVLLWHLLFKFNCLYVRTLW